MMELSVIERLISNVGFPIAVTLFFMLRTEKAINNNTKALTDIKVVVEKCKHNGS